MESKELDRGGIEAVFMATEISQETIRKSIKELENPNLAKHKTVRRKVAKKSQKNNKKSVKHCSLRYVLTQNFKKYHVFKRF